MDSDSAPPPVAGTPDDPTRTLQIPEASPGVLIGPYQLVRQLGEGGMGVVYHARQLQPIHRDVALKVIKPGMDSKQVIARFESERQALAMMDHPNIAHVFDAGATERGLPYFAMELVDGVPITRYCDSKRLTVRERIELFIPICRAIQHAHQKGIIHRDIKPSNILVTQQENKAIPKVIDFGLAKALGGHITEATMMTNLGTVVGTLHYMSPEQAEVGRHDVDTRSDIYSLGAVLYELLTGATPLDRELLAKVGYAEALKRIREEEPKRPSVRLRQSGELKDAAGLRQCDPGKLPRILHQELDWIAMKALEKDRSRRYETVNGLVRDLQRYLNGEPVEAAPPSAAYRLGKYVHKYRPWLATAAAFIAILVAGAAVSTWMAIKASRAEQEARAVNDFLQNDLLAQASAEKQARPDTKPDPNLTVRTALDRAAGRIEGKFATQPGLEAAIRQTIGNTYKDLGLFREAERHLERALDLRRRVLGEKHPDTLTSMDRLAGAYDEQGKYEQAELLNNRALEARRQVLGDQHPDTLRSMSHVATGYLRQGKFAEAEPLYAAALAGQLSRLGEEHSETLDTMNNLAAIYVRLYRYDQAGTQFSRILAIRRRLQGMEHPRTLGVMQNLAAVYHSQAKYPEAELLYREALGTYRRVLGDDHPRTLRVATNLALLSLDQRKYGDAGASFIRVLESRRRVLGDEHPDTLSALVYLAHSYDLQGKHGVAKPLFIKALEALQRVLGPEHPETVKTLASLGEVRLRLKENAEAEAALRDALSIFEKIKYDGWERFDCQSALGSSLAGQGRYDEAEPLVVAGYEGMVQREATISAPDRPALLEAGERILSLYSAWGKPNKVGEWQAKLAKMQNSSSPKSP